MGINQVDLFLYLTGRPVAKVAVVSGGGVAYEWITTDHLGTPAVVTDAAGVEVWSGGFEPFGRDYSLAAGTSLRLPGQSIVLNQDDLSMVYNVFRWYDLTVGRYLSKDPLGDAIQDQPPSVSGGPGEERFSLYFYADSNPVIFIDPLGLLRFKGCRPGDDKKLEQALEEYCSKVTESGFKDCICEKDSIPGRLERQCSSSRLTMRCHYDADGRCKPNGPDRITCGWSVPMGKTVHVCPGAWTPYCGPLGCTLLHELTHQIGFTGEKWPDQVESCLGCP